MCIGYNMQISELLTGACKWKQKYAKLFPINKDKKKKIKQHINGLKRDEIINLLKYIEKE